MSKANQLGENIHSLRLAFGETLEQLGAEIGGFQKNTIHSYETGRTRPNRETLRMIAKHYMISVEELLYSDLTCIGSISIEKDAFWKNIGSILPIVSSERSLQNIHFKKAFDAHSSCYEMFPKVNLDNLDLLDVCFDEYFEALDDESIEEEVAGNFLALWYLMIAFVRLAPSILKDRPAMLLQLSKKDSNAKKVIDFTEDSVLKEADDISESFKDDDMKELFSEMLIVIKNSTRWADLAYYYLALQYLWNMADNDLEWAYNQRIGVEMLKTYASIGNEYAKQYIKIVFSAMKS